MSHVEVLEREYPPIRFKADGIQPPSDLFITKDDAIFVTSYNAATGVALKICYTILLPTGEIKVGALDTHVPNTDRTAKTTVQNLGQGFLLSVSAFVASGTVRRGQCYIQVGISRGYESARFVHRILMQGYVGAAVNLSWPGDRLIQPTEGPGARRYIQGTDPAAGAAPSETVPTGARWRLVSWFINLTTSAVVGSRRSTLYFASGSIQPFQSPHPSTVTASLTRGFTWAIGMALSANIANSGDPAGLPADCILPPGGQINIATANFDGADNYDTPFYTVEEWIEP